MKKSLFLFSILISFVFSYSQETPKTTHQNILNFYKTKTYVVLDDNPISDYNMKIEDEMKKYWKLTEYQFISQEEFNRLRLDPKNSFLILSTVVFHKDKLQAKYDFFSLLLGGPYSVIKAMPIIAQVPLGYTEAPQESKAYKLGAMLKFLQAHIELVKEKPEILDDNVFKYYNDSQKSIKDKTLYLIKEEMPANLNSKTEIAAHYPYNIKFVTRDEIEKAIDAETKDVVFLHKVGPENVNKKARCYKLILGTDKELYYFDWHMISDKKPDGLLESDFKKLAKFEN